ncbi:MAG: Peptidase protein [Pseudomonadota bacterium]|nr:Peptidase protein [Pseudomonadota bacterium]
MSVLSPDRRQLMLALGAGLLAPRLQAAPVVAVPFYGAQVMLAMQRRHAWLPAARQWRVAAQGLAQQLEQGCTGAARAPARQAWIRTMQAWTRASAVSTGALLQRRSSRSIDFQPTRPRLIEQAIAQLREQPAPLRAPDAARLERTGSPARGLPALEWLLWSREAPTDAAACAWAAGLAQELAREAAAIEADWLAQEARDAESETDEEDLRTRFAEFVNQWLGAIELLRWAEIERPWRAGRDDKTGWPRQTSGTTASAWQARWEAIRTLTLSPTPAPAPGEGLVPMALYLRSLGLMPLSDRLDAVTRQADAALHGLQPTAPAARLQAATRALARLKGLVENEVAAALQVNIGFSDADGD